MYAIRSYYDVAPYVDELAELKVSHVTITMNAFDPEVTKDVYQWVRFDKRGYVGAEGAKVLLEKQLEAIKLLKLHNITVKINTIVIPGINDHLIGDIAKQAKELGADLMNTIPLYVITSYSIHYTKLYD